MRHDRRHAFVPRTRFADPDAIEAAIRDATAALARH
jgi:hypothetical protein